MKSVVTVLGLLVLVPLRVFANKYCDPSLCPLGRLHIICNETSYNPYVSGCYNIIRVADSEVVKEIALRTINEVRDQVAAGYHPLFPQASRMPIIEWDEELESIAKEVVLLCTYSKTDACLNTPTYRQISQLYYQSYASIPTDYFQQFTSAVDQWRANEKLVTAQDLAKPNEIFIQNSDFAILINQRATRVGCSINFQYLHSRTFVACLFSTSLVPSKPVYDAGKAGTRCKKGKSPCYTSLCL